MNNKFKVGDRVICTISIHPVLKGDLGTVLEDGPAPYVCWDNYSKYKHNSRGLCKRGHGFALAEHKMALYVEDNESESGEQNDN